MLGAGFEDTDLVLSDFIIGAYLLSVQHREMRKSLKEIRENEQSEFASKHECMTFIEKGYDEPKMTCAPPVLQKLTIHKEPRKSILYNEQFRWLDNKNWDSIELLAHYAKYAVVCYSYKLYMLWEPRACLHLFSKGPTCCACIP